MDALANEARKGGWWNDVLQDPKLLVALRGTYLNVYWRGQSLFRVKLATSGLKVTTHEKYLVNPKLASQVKLTDGHFDVSRLVEEGFIRHYEGPKTIAKMKSAAGLFSGDEKSGCHEVAVRNPGVIDREIAFPGMVSSGNDDPGMPQVDLASLEADGEDARLIFWEAKHFSNGDLRAEGDTPPVCVQMKRYETYLGDNRVRIEQSYTRMAANFVALHQMGLQRRLSPLITDVGTGRRRLTLGAEPKVGLIVFGFDEAQRDHDRWQNQLARLKTRFRRVRTAGDAKNLRLPT